MSVPDWFINDDERSCGYVNRIIREVRWRHDARDPRIGALGLVSRCELTTPVEFSRSQYGFFLAPTDGFAVRFSLDPERGRPGLGPAYYFAVDKYGYVSFWAHSKTLYSSESWLGCTDERAFLGGIEDLRAEDVVEQVRLHVIGSVLAM